MTNREAISWLISLAEKEGEDVPIYEEDVEAIQKAIEALEQEPFINKKCVAHQVCHDDKVKVLDKIRAEIEQNAYPIVHGVNNHEKGMTLYGILQVIDKYKAEESEDKEC